MARIHGALACHDLALAAAVLFVLVAVYLAPALIGGEMLSPNSLLYRWAPWNTLIPADIYDYYNPLLSDIPTGHYPWNAYARELLRAGTFPAWNPHAFGGVPFFANPQTMLFSPFSIPLWTLPLNYALGVSAALKLWVAGFGTYLLVRELRLGLFPALLAAIGYALCSFHVVWLTHESLPAVSALLPWMIWLVERVVRERRPATLAALSIVTAVALTGGHPGTQLHVLAAAGLYGVLRVGTLPDLRTGERVRRAALAMGALVLGMLLVAVILVPELLSANGTLGTEARRAGEITAPGSDMPLKVLASTIFPDWWGRPSSDVLDSALGVNYNERTFYAGAITLLLAVLGVAARDEWRRKLPFAVLGLLALAVALQAPGLTVLTDNLPAFNVVQNQRIHFVFELSLVVLAAFGLHALLAQPRGDRWRLAVPAAALCVAFAALVQIAPAASELRDTVVHFTSGSSFFDADVLALTSVAWWSIFAVVLGAAMIALRRWPRRGTAIASALLLIAALDMLHFANGYQPMAPASKVIPPETLAIAYLQRHADRGRIVGVEYTLPNAWSLLYGLRDVRGYDPPQPSLRFYRLWQLANPDQLNWAPFNVQDLSPLSVRVLSLLGARYIVAEPDLPTPSRDTPELRWLRRVYAGRDATIFENRAAVPRATVASELKLTRSERATRGALTNDRYRPDERIVVERGAATADGLGEGRLPGGTVRVADETNATVTLDATLAGRGIVVLNDNHTDGWTVRVDGQERPQLLVNDVMRGVVVDGGRHRIRWSYEVPGLRFGAALSLAALVGLVGACGLLMTRRRLARRNKETR